MSVTIVSVGNGGFNLASDIVCAKLFPDAQVLVCDTNRTSAEDNSKDACKFFLLPKAKRIFKSKDIVLVDNIVESLSDTVVICSTFGGLTGSLYAPLIALAARLSGRFVCSVIALPYRFEGEAKTNRAIDAYLQIANSSHLTFKQNNERLSDVKDLWADGMNKPMVETMLSALKNGTLKQLSLNALKQNSEFIPTAYRVDDFPLLTIIGDACHNFSDIYLRRIFDFMDD